MSSPAASAEKLHEITKNRMKLSLCLIMIIEHNELRLDELIKLTGYKFAEVNGILNNLVRLKLIDTIPTGDLPAFKIINHEDARNYLKLLEENFHLEA